MRTAFQNNLKRRPFFRPLQSAGHTDVPLAPIDMVSSVFTIQIKYVDFDVEIRKCEKRIQSPHTINLLVFNVFACMGLRSKVR